MDDQRVGAALRAVRIKRGWTQKEVADRGRVSRGIVSLIERGHLDQVSTPAFRRLAAALGIRVDIVLRLPHGELERLVNAGHAAMHEALSRHLGSLSGWVQSPEVSFAIYSERGVIDILAFHEPTRSLLVIELKTELVEIEGLLATMDVRLRHAARIARERGWLASSVSGWVVIAEGDTNRRRVHAHSSTLRSAFPSDGRRMRAWLSNPNGSVRALSFWANFDGTTVTRTAAARRRVRKPRPAQKIRPLMATA